jgi:hypothetical protein
VPTITRSPASGQRPACKAALSPWLRTGKPESAIAWHPDRLPADELDWAVLATLHLDAEIVKVDATIERRPRR